MIGAREGAVVVGDPGVPVMIGLLAVPVVVLLFVVSLALAGRRWTAPEPPEEFEDAYDEEPAPPAPAPWPADPWRPAPPPEPRPLPPAPVRHALPAGPQPSRDPQPARDLLPAPRPYRPAAPPPARPSYGVLSHDPRDVPPEQEPDQGYGQGFPYGPYRYQ